MMTEFVGKYIVEEETEETSIEGESHSAYITGTGDASAPLGTENEDDDGKQEAKIDASPAKSTRSRASSRSPAKSPAKSPLPETSGRASRHDQTKATHTGDTEHAPQNEMRGKNLETSHQKYTDKDLKFPSRVFSLPKS